MTLITHPPDETHANRYYSSGAHCFVVEIKHRWLSRSREYSLALDRSVEFNYGSAVWLAKRLYDEFYRMDRASPLSMEGLTLEMMAEVSRRHVKTSEGTSPRWLEQARDPLHAHFSEELALEGIAGAVGTHPVHLARVFRQYYGCTIGEYMRRLRVEFACREMSLTNTPLLQVALAAGFTIRVTFRELSKKSWASPRLRIALLSARANPIPI